MEKISKTITTLVVFICHATENEDVQDQIRYSLIPNCFYRGIALKATERVISDGRLPYEFGLH